MTECKDRTKETAIIAIAVLEAVALAKGIDGTMLAIAFSIIGGLAGYELRTGIEKLKRKE